MSNYSTQNGSQVSEYSESSYRNSGFRTKIDYTAVAAENEPAISGCGPDRGAVDEQDRGDSEMDESDRASSGGILMQWSPDAGSAEGTVRSD